VDLVGWWTGKYRVTGRSEQPKRGGKGKSGFVVTAGIGEQGPFAKVDKMESRRSVVPVGDRASAKEQLKNARSRAQAMRERASQRRCGVRRNSKAYKNTPGVGVVFAGILGLALLLGGAVVVGSLLLPANPTRAASMQSSPEAPMPPITQYPHDLPQVDANALVITHNTNAIDPETRVHMLAGLSMLNDHGLDTYGDLGAGVDEQVIGLLADYRNTLGAIPSDSDELIVRTRSWIEKQADTDAVMLVASDPETSELQLIVVTMPFYTTLAIDEGTVPALLTLMKNNGFAAVPD
jgi:hypothetical protein